MQAFAIMQSNNEVFQSTKYSGYLGFGPYSSNSLINEESILYHLKSTKQIDYAIVSLYLQKDQPSSLKFGGYDQAALKDYSDFEVFKTTGRESWRIKAEDPKLNNKSFDADTKTEIEF